MDLMARIYHEKYLEVNATAKAIRLGRGGEKASVSSPEGWAEPAHFAHYEKLLAEADELEQNSKLWDAKSTAADRAAGPLR